jgi:antitoxin PrlF
MAKTKKTGNTSFDCSSMGSCKIDALLSVDERGQMVLPKDMRDKAGIQPGDKLAALSWENEGQTICICLIKADNFAELIKGFLSPIFKSMFNSKGE